MSLSMQTDMIRFDPGYLGETLNEMDFLSFFGHDREKERSIGIPHLKFASSNMHSLAGRYINALNPSREITKEIDTHYSVSPTAEWYDPLGVYGFSLEPSTNLMVPPVDFGSLIFWEKNARAKATLEAIYSYASRIEFLREEAIIESVDFNENSKHDFWMFIRLVPFIKRGSLFLMDNGDLRVVWDDEEGNLVGIQFLGNSLARYVIFKRREESMPVSRVAGTDTLKGVDDQVRAFKLENLLSA
ncbi:MAG: hypothetical protein OXC97_04485 [Candidatus Dadabacteria bacterium]|nr:hypothetical protein [Candidatus Dadabacteria bacterium]